MDVRLADIADIRTGYSFRGKIDDDPAGGLSVVQMRDVRQAGHLDTEACLRIQEEPAHGRHLLQPGDVVLQARGTTFPAGIVEAPFHGIAAFGLHVLHPSDKVLPEYLVWALNQPTMQIAISGVAKGSTIAFVSKTNLAQLHIPLTGIQAQHQIAHVASLERKASALAAELQDLRKHYVAAVTWRAASKD